MLALNAGEFGIEAEVVGRAAKQVPFVAAFTLTNVMKDAREAERKTMRSVFDRPTNCTLNALQVRPATKQRLQAELGFKEGFGSVPAWKYLGPQVAGGPRKAKRFELALRAKGHPALERVLRARSRHPARRLRQHEPRADRPHPVRARGASGAAQNTVRRPKRSTRKRNLDYFGLCLVCRFLSCACKWQPKVDG
ncbi:hypothetical protein [Methylobacterium sp. CM6257]